MKKFKCPFDHKMPNGEMVRLCNKSCCYYSEEQLVCMFDKKYKGYDWGKPVDYCGICGCNLYSYKHGGICNKKSCQREWESRQAEYKKMFPIGLDDLRELAYELSVPFGELLLCVNSQGFIYIVLMGDEKFIPKEEK